MTNVHIFPQITGPHTTRRSFWAIYRFSCYHFRICMRRHSSGPGWVVWRNLVWFVICFAADTLCIRNALLMRMMQRVFFDSICLVLYSRQYTVWLIVEVAMKLHFEQFDWICFFKLAIPSPLPLEVLLLYKLVILKVNFRWPKYGHII